MVFIIFTQPWFDGTKSSVSWYENKWERKSGYTHGNNLKERVKTQLYSLTYIKTKKKFKKVI